jgi:hypothetical protein
MPFAAVCVWRMIGGGVVTRGEWPAVVSMDNPTNDGVYKDQLCLADGCFSGGPHERIS